MNFLYKPLLLLVFILSQNLSFSQYVPIDIDSKIEKSVAIIEGTVIDKFSYFDRNQEIYTENIIEVLGVLKGTVDKETISIITFGGHKDGKTMTWSHCLGLRIGQTGAFFITENTRPERDNSNTQKFEVYSGSQGFYEYVLSESGYRAKAVLDDQQSVEEFYKVVGGDYSDNVFHFKNYDKSNVEKCLEYKIVPKDIAAFAGNSNFIYYDVFIKIKGGSYKLNKSEIYLNYSTEWFYPNMVGTGKLVYETGEAFKEDYNFSISDYSSDVLHLNLEASTSTFSSLVTINNEYKKVGTVGVEVNSISSQEPISEYLAVNNITNNYLNENGQLENFECVNVYFDSNCEMEIFSATISGAAGVGIISTNGVNGELYLQGENFLDDNPQFECAKPINHRVKFRTNDGEWISPLEGDYILYTNTEIRVKIPTRGYINDSDVLYTDGDLNTKFACTGRVVVCKDRTSDCECNVESSDLVYVPFVANNKIQDNSEGCKESVPIVMRNFDGSGGTTIRFTPDFKATAGAVEAYSRAVESWVCETQVNLIVDPEIGPITQDGSAIVRFATLAAGTRASTGVTIEEKCGDDPNVEYYYSQGFLMSFNSNFGWHTGLDMPELNWDGSGAGMIEGDMESTTLHELGHAQFLLHTCNPQNVMIRPGVLDYRRSLHVDDIAGGIHNAFQSNTEDADNCTGSPMELIPFTDCIVSTRNNGNKDLNVQVFPNPTKDVFDIEVQNEIGTLENGKIVLINLNGVPVLEKQMANLNRITINVSDLANGMYFISYHGENIAKQVIGKISKIE